MNTATKRHRWLPWQEELLRGHYATSLTADLAEVLGVPPSRVLAKANAMGLHKSRELIAEIARERSVRPEHGGRRTRFRPGQLPMNKGTKGVMGVQEACRATQFKPGNLPHTWVPVGSYTINGDGVLDRKISEEPGPRHKRWKPVTRLVWEAAHGPIPAGHAVVFKPGRASTDPELITLDAIELLTRRELMARNTLHAVYPPDLVRVAQPRGLLTRTINQRQKERKP